METGPLMLLILRTYATVILRFCQIGIERPPSVIILSILYGNFVSPPLVALTHFSPDISGPTSISMSIGLILAALGELTRALMRVYFMKT
ncbi:hypothetical protein F5884DRAFT_801344 [Xylogone sp. PMI_703]|nr:hypothetical protein F5884DRAFT_801344 [Xylogone sp. PMI_703]